MASVVTSAISIATGALAFVVLMNGPWPSIITAPLVVVAILGLLVFAIPNDA